MDKGFLGDLFDVNHDGELDGFERTLDYMAFEDLTSVDSQEEDLDDDIELAGLSRDELEWMDEDERREALEDAGLDSDDYDF